MNDLLRLPLAYLRRLAYAARFWAGTRGNDPPISARTAWDVACILRETPAEERRERERVRRMLADVRAGR